MEQINGIIQGESIFEDTMKCTLCTCMYSVHCKPHLRGKTLLEFQAWTSLLSRFQSYIKWERLLRITHIWNSFQLPKCWKLVSTLLFLALVLLPMCTHFITPGPTLHPQLFHSLFLNLIALYQLWKCWHLWFLSYHSSFWIIAKSAVCRKL